QRGTRPRGSEGYDGKTCKYRDKYYNRRNFEQRLFGSCRDDILLLQEFQKVRNGLGNAVVANFHGTEAVLDKGRQLSLRVDGHDSVNNEKRQKKDNGCQSPENSFLRWQIYSGRRLIRLRKRCNNNSVPQ